MEEVEQFDNISIEELAEGTEINDAPFKDLINCWNRTPREFTSLRRALTRA